MQGVYQRKYGVETKIDFVLFETDGISFKTDAVCADGDAKIMKDEGDEANTTNGFADGGQGYSITLTATEMEAARIVVYIADQSDPKVWLDTAFVIETYGHADAQHALDRDSATVTTDAASRTASKATGFSTHDATAVWAVGARTLTSFGTLVADVATAVWAAAGRTLTTFGFTVTTDAASRDASKADVSGLSTHSAGAAGAAAAAAVVGDAAFKRLLAFGGEYRRAADLVYDDASGEVTSAVIKLYNSKAAFDADEPDATVNYSATLAAGRVTAHTSEKQE